MKVANETCEQCQKKGEVEVFHFDGDVVGVFCAACLDAPKQESQPTDESVPF